MYSLKLLLLKTISKIGKKAGKGSSFPGLIDTKLKFDILNDINFGNIPIIFVIGTNGKTTTANMIYELLSNQNKVVANLLGANLTSGIKTTLIDELKYSKKLDADIILLEVDEKTLKEIVKIINPTHVVITNFFRDQLDRYGEIDLIISEIICSLNETKAKIFLNGNDPLQVYRFEKCTCPITYYGVAKHKLVTYKQEKKIEIKYCPHCITLLQYDFYHYGHIGKYHCPNCSFEQKPIDFELSIDFEINKMNLKGNSVIVDASKFPTYFFFNIVAASAIVLELKNPWKEPIQNLVNNFEFPRGRNQHLFHGQQEIYFNLAKNVVGFEETIEYLTQRFESFDLLVAFNDNYADGLDVSWIWDVELMPAKEHINNVYIVGTRRFDMALRFQADGYKKITVLDSIDNGVKAVLANQTNVGIISNYTPLVSINNSLKRQVKTYV